MWELGSLDFAWLLTGLSDRSRFRRVAADEPNELTEAGARRALAGGNT